MALKSKQKYDPEKIEKLAEHIRLYHQSGDPIDYEIVVDGFKAVRRTNNPQMFSLYENFVGADTKVMEINFYIGNSNTYDKHVFLLSDEPHESLNGVDVDKRIQERVKYEREKWDCDQIKKRNEELEREIAGLEEEINKLEAEKQELVNTRSPLHGFLGEFGSSFVESFIRRNPKVVSGLPGGEALAGLMSEGQEEKSGETEVSFKPKSEAAGELSSENKAAIEFVNQLKQQFTRQEFDKILTILQRLSAHKAGIDWILENLKPEEGTHE